MITVALPVGPKPIHKKWLQQAIDSVTQQMKSDDELLLIDDMADLPIQSSSKIRVYRTPWLVGCATGWNFGISLARNDLVLMMGSDDWLEPNCFEQLKRYWNQYQNPLGYYYLSIRYVPEPGIPMPQYEIQNLPCNAAMVHKTLWKRTGGFPPETAIGAPDSCFVSILIAHGASAGYIIPVQEGKPLYNVRLHSEQDTAYRGPYQSAIFSVRDILTRNWQVAKWGRYIP